MIYKVAINLVIAGAFIAVFMQNCGQEAKFNADKSALIAAENNDAEGDFGSGGGGFDCVAGQKLLIYLDPDSSGKIKENNYLGHIVSYSGTTTAAANYNYFSASAHPLVGPKPVGFKSNVFFFDGSDGMALNLFSNIDAGGSDENVVHVDLAVSGNSSNDGVLLSDDGGEIKEVNESQYQGRFKYWNNTDGGVIGPFAENSPFIVRVKFLSTGDVQSARFYSANGFSFSLAKDDGKISSFIIKNSSYETCQSK